MIRDLIAGMAEKYSSLKDRIGFLHNGIGPLPSNVIAHDTMQLNYDYPGSEFDTIERLQAYLTEILDVARIKVMRPKATVLVLKIFRGVSIRGTARKVLGLKLLDGQMHLSDGLIIKNAFYSIKQITVRGTSMSVADSVGEEYGLLLSSDDYEVTIRSRLSVYAKFD